VPYYYYINHEGVITMARHTPLTPNKTYATEANAIKAVEKLFPNKPNANGKYDGLNYFLQRTEDGRFFPVFIGERAMQAMVHFHFNIVA
jgi:hypothetical protein